MTPVIEVLLIFYYWVTGTVLAVIPRHWRHKNIKGDIVLITGGANGLGQKLALRFAKLVSHVVLWDIDEDGLRKTATEVTANGGHCSTYVVDLTDRSKIYEVAKTVRKEVGIVTILVNNAGTVIGKDVLSASDESIEKVFEINTLAHYWTCKAFMPDMRARNHGHLVTIDSVVALTPAGGITEYVSSKCATYGFHEAFAIETNNQGFDGIKFTLVCPWQLNTTLFKGATAALPPLDVERVADEIISSVRANREYVYLPWVYHILHLLKVIMPWRAYYQLTITLGGKTAFSQFKGKYE